MVVCMEVKFGVHVYLMVSMTTSYKYILTSCLELLIHSSNLLLVAHIEVKLCVHVYIIVSMTLTNKNSLRHFSFELLVNGSTHGDETWYVCVFKSFHNNHQQHIASGTFPSSPVKLTNSSTHGDKTLHIVYLIISMRTRRQVN